MRKTVASAVISLLVFSLGCANWQKYTPKQLDQKAIEAEIRKHMVSDGITGISIDVDKDGVVTLKGNLKTAADRQKAYDDAAKVHGVSRVVNRITVGP
jgi:osmotically-inducible protein OsmY